MSSIFFSILKTYGGQLSHMLVTLTTLKQKQIQNQGGELRVLPQKDRSFKDIVFHILVNFKE